MSFTLKSIELKNIRAHEYFLFEPALEGITAISGDNGAGKSTIVDAFAWCLYGTRPSGVRNKDMIKDGVDPRVKPVSIKASLNIGGIDYTIERKIITAQGSVECNVWGKVEGSDKLTSVAGPAVSHVEKFVRNELGMNEKGFLASVLIQQKQVDQIISASPRERGAVIEELTGISAITEAIRKTNENTRALQKAASIFHTGDIEEAKEKVSLQENVVKQLLLREANAVQEFKDMKLTYSDLEEEYKLEGVKVRKRDNFNQKINNLVERIDFLTNQAAEDLEYIKNHKTKYGTTIIVDVKTAKERVEQKRNESFEVKSKGNSISKELKEIKKDITSCNILRGEFANIEKALSKAELLDKELENKSNKLEELTSRKSMLTSEIKHSNESHKHINGKDTNCPVCKSKIENPEELKSEIQSEIKQFKSEKDKVTNEIKIVKEEIERASEEVKTVRISIEAIKEKARLEERQEELQKKFQELTKKNSLIKTDLIVLEREYNNALQIEADKNALESAKKRSLTVNATIAKNKKDLEVLKASLSQLEALTDRSFAALEKRLEVAKDRLSRMSLAGKELQGRKTLERERLGDYKKNLKEVEEAMERYNEIAEEINISTGASAMLSAFKADRIEHSIPTLEFFASDFLTKFTGGAFTRLTMDEKFNTFVTTSAGVVRPVAQLSGGELSSAAIALRLGIAMLLSSSEKNVLILDEVLVSMDEDRSRQIMETIGSMTNSQVIFIAHNTDINSVADKTILVVKE